MVLECNESTNVIETVTPVGLPYKNNKATCRKYGRKAQRGTNVLIYGWDLIVFVTLKSADSKTFQ